MASAAAVAMTDEEVEKKDELADTSDVESVDEDMATTEASASEAERPSTIVEKRRVTPPPLPATETTAEAAKPVETDKTEKPAASPKPVATSGARKRLPISATLFGVLFLLNATAIAGTLVTRRDARRDVAPIGSIATNVAQLSTDQAGTRAELEETKKKLAVQDAKLAAVARATDETAARQKAAERAAEEHDAKAARDLAAVAGRVSTLERRARDGAVTMSLSDALPVLDAVGAASAPAAPATRQHHTH